MAEPPFMPERRSPLDRSDVDLASLPYRDTVQEEHNRHLLAARAPIRVYVDDVRQPSRAPERWVIVRTAYEAVQLLSNHEIAKLSLDQTSEWAIFAHRASRRICSSSSARAMT